MNNKIRIALFLILFVFTTSLTSCVAKSYCATIMSERANYGGTYIDVTVKKEMQKEVEGKLKSLKYKYTISCATKAMDLKMYEDDEGNFFEYVGDELKGFLYTTPGGRLLLETPPDDIDEAVESFLKAKVNIEKYILVERKEFKIYSHEGSKVSSVDYLYQKKINGFFTSDSIRVRADNNKKVFSYNVYNEGLFDNVKIPEIDRDNCIAELETKLNEYYTNCNAEMKSYTIEEETLTLTRDSKVSIMYTVSIEAVKNSNEQSNPKRVYTELVYADIVIN